MAGVNPYQKKPGLFSQLLPIAGQVGGAVAGGAFGGPAGAAAGAAVGGKLGQSVGADAPPQTPVQTTPIQRRIETYDGAMQDPTADLNAANSALQQLPPAMQQRYGPTLYQAQQANAKARGLA